jgi:hypothetical protein
LQVHETQEELEKFFLKLQQVEGELGKLKLQQKMEVDNNEEKPTEYQLLVWEGWYAYHCGRKQQMLARLQLSLRHTPFSRTETILDWLNCFARFAEEQEKSFNTQALTSSPEWKQLMQRIAVTKPEVAST